MRAALAAIPFVLTLAACATEVPLPAGVTEDEVGIFRAAVVEAGCDVTNDTQAAVVEERTGFDSGKLRQITEYTARRGELSDTGQGGFRLNVGTCAAA
ncbi:hypothetical protein [Pelagovum pacificum]|uniref:NADH dehydrogenase n=1 Tax=Pelagovum pacificum TaxID=2588711 RepID=A0A5C5GD71_9RHOB|nr:hypothetical protein [Pelagovum pacificum]QQA44183.1 hypothetical protein I8N54_06285 [Pelagovum pacificum]TNY32693.1 hypothetical protein FHY64_05280 [Pelagovum pacificum]